MGNLRQGLISFIVPIIIALLVVHLIGLAEIQSGFDFLIYRKAAEYLVMHQNPYALPHYSTYACSYGIACPGPPTKDSNLMTWTNPSAFVPLLPFVLVNQQNALLGYKCFSYLVYLSSFLYCLCESITQKQKRYTINIILMLFIFPWASFLQAFKWGSIAPIAALGLLLFVIALRRKYYFLSGMFLSLTVFFRLHSFLLVYGIILFWSIRNRNYRVISGAVSVLILSIIIVFLVNSSAFIDYLQIILLEGEPFKFVTASIPSYFLGIFDLSRKYSIVPMIVIVGYLACKVLPKLQTGYPLDELIIVILPLSVIFAPYGWIHDYVDCIPHFAYVGAFIMRQYEIDKKSFSAFKITILYIITNLYGLTLHLAGANGFYFWSFSLALFCSNCFFLSVLYSEGAFILNRRD